MLGLYPPHSVSVLSVEVDVAPEVTEQEGSSHIYWKQRTPREDKLVCNSTQFTSPPVSWEKIYPDTMLKKHQSFHTFCCMLTLISSIQEKNIIGNWFMLVFFLKFHTCVKHQKENLTQSTQYFWRRESQVLVTIRENDNLTFEKNNIAGSKANVPPACILHKFTHYKPQLQGPYQQDNQSETESTIHKYNSVQLQDV